MGQGAAQGRHAADADTGNALEGFGQHGYGGPHQRRGFEGTVGTQGAEPQSLSRAGRTGLADLADLGQTLSPAEPSQADQIRRLDQPLFHQIDQPGTAGNEPGLVAVASQDVERLLKACGFDIFKRAHADTLPSATAWIDSIIL